MHRLSIGIYEFTCSIDYAFTLWLCVTTSYCYVRRIYMCWCLKSREDKKGKTKRKVTHDGQTQRPQACRTSRKMDPRSFKSCKESEKMKETRKNDRRHFFFPFLLAAARGRVTANLKPSPGTPMSTIPRLRLVELIAWPLETHANMDPELFINHALLCPTKSRKLI